MMDVLRLFNVNGQETTFWSLFAILNTLNTNHLVRHVNQYKKFNVFVVDILINIYACKTHLAM